MAEPQSADAVRGSASVMRALAPMLVLVLWCAAGQWGSSGREPRAWLLFVGVVGAAALVPLARRQTSRACLITHVEQWGWVALAGLLVVT